MINIQEIRFPNNALSNGDMDMYNLSGIHGIMVDEFKYIYKQGEMGLIAWIAIIKDNKVIAEIKESVCNLYGEDEYREKN